MYAIIKVQKGDRNPIPTEYKNFNQKKEVSFMKKLTKKEMFNAIANVISVMDNAEVLAVVDEQNITPDMALEFINKEIAQLEKKSSSRSSAKNAENEKLKEEILATMEEIGKPARLSEIIAKNPELGSQNKVNAMLTQMKQDGVIIRTIDKKAAYFSIAQSIKNGGASAPPPFQKEASQMKYSLNNGKVVTIPDDEIQNSMDKLKLSLHEAIQMWLEDNEFELNEEQEELDQKAKQVKIKLGATSANKERKKTKERTVKISDEKKRLFDVILNELIVEYGENVEVKTENKLIQVKIGEKTFKVDLIEQRAKKKAE